MLGAILAERARRDFYQFVKQAWHVVEPAMPFIENWHVGAVCEHLTAVTRGEIQRLLINMPPGHAKSLLVSVFWPAWVWINKPTWRAIFSAYAEGLSTRDSIRCRALIESQWYIENFLLLPDGSRRWKLSGDQNVKTYFKNSELGERLSVSVGSKATGFRGDAVVCDDPLNALDAPSKLKRDEAIFWWDKVMSTRVNDPRIAAFVMMMQRLHEDDPSGHLLEVGGYEHLCLPSEFDPKKRSVTFITKPKHEQECPLKLPAKYPSAQNVLHNELDREAHELPLPDPHRFPHARAVVSDCIKVNRCECPRESEQFWQDPRTEAGEMLFPELFTKDVLKEQRKRLGSDGYAGQHQQRPAPEDGEKFKKGWWRFWKPDGKAPDFAGRRPDKCYQGPALALPALDLEVISLDATFKDTDGTDYVVFTVWGCQKVNRFLLDRRRGRMSFTETLRVFRELSRLYPKARRKLVEDKANGSAIIDTLKSEIAGIVAIQPEGGKEARAAAVSPQIESGNVYLPDGVPWVEEYIDEFTVFPNGRNDDQVDSTTQALLELAGSSGVARAKGLANL